MARGGGKAPKNVTWIICLILYLIAVLDYFGVIRIDNAIAGWCWIVGYAVLLLAVKVRNL
jgi:ABC-type multidrug transport system permease subunit